MPLRVAFTTLYGQWSAFSPLDIFEPGASNMVAGGETAMLWLARGLAAAGHEVDLFYDVRRPGRFYGVNFLPKALKVPMLLCTDYDILVSWEDTEALQVAHRAELVVYAAQCNTMQIGVLDYGVDWYQCVSEWHVDTLFSSDQTVSPEKFFVFPNGVDPQRYAQTVEREPFRIIHTSSPDRGLHNLLELWPRFKKAVPQASLHIYYEIKLWLDLVDHWNSQKVTLSTTERAAWVREGLAKTESMDVFVHGAVGQWQLAQEQQRSSLLWYPCSPVQPTEGFSISILEALTAGTPVLTSNADAFPELWGQYTVQIPLIDADEAFYTFTEEQKNQHFRERGHLWIDTARDLLTNRKRRKALIKAGKTFAADFDWRDLGDAYAEGLAAKYEEKHQRVNNPTEIVMTPAVQQDVMQGMGAFVL